LCPHKRRDTDSKDADCEPKNEKSGKTETLIIKKRDHQGGRGEIGENRETEIQKGDCEPGRRKITDSTETLIVQRTDCEPGKEKRQIVQRHL
jgi:hypothetical protein